MWMIDDGHVDVMGQVVTVTSPLSTWYSAAFTFHTLESVGLRAN